MSSRVRILDGRFRGIDGEVVESSGANRPVRVVLDEVPEGWPADLNGLWFRDGEYGPAFERVPDA